MVFRDPKEEEIPVIRKLYVPGERAGAFLTFLIGCLPLVCIPLAIMTIIRKGSIPFAVFSIIVQLFFVLWAIAFFSITVDSIRKIGCVKKGNYQVCDCQITKVKDVAGYKRKTTWVTVETHEGETVKMESRGGVSEKFKTGRSAVIVKFNTKKDIDNELVQMPE